MSPSGNRVYPVGASGSVSANMRLMVMVTGTVTVNIVSISPTLLYPLKMK